MGEINKRAFLSPAVYIQRYGEIENVEPKQL
jgi:hypothetical protein